MMESTRNCQLPFPVLSNASEYFVVVVIAVVVGVAVFLMSPTMTAFSSQLAAKPFRISDKRELRNAETSFFLHLLNWSNS